METLDLSAKELKYKTSRLYELCTQLWPFEFKYKFTAPREEFKKWLNLKTEMDVCHITNKNFAINAWLEKLEQLAK